MEALKRALWRFLLFVLVWILQSVVAWKCWNWFVPAMGGPEIPYLLALGLFILAAVVLMREANPGGALDPLPSNDAIFVAVGGRVMTTAFLLLSGWVVHLLIGWTG